MVRPGELHAVWYASAGCLPDGEHPEFVGTLSECEVWVVEHGEEYVSGARHDLYALTIEPLPDEDLYSITDEEGELW